MYPHYTTYFPADAMPRAANTGEPITRRAERPFVLLAFAKLVLMVGALVIFAPAWLDLLREMADAPQGWGSHPVAVLAGGAAVITLGVLILKVWTGLLKHLARAD
jgi:hypothetical protein